MKHLLVLAALSAAGAAQAQSGATLDHPAVSPSGAPVSNDAGALKLGPQGATASQTLANFADLIGIQPELYKVAADGVDDAPSIQRAVSAACGAALTRTVRFQARHYAINSQVVVPCQITFRGEGFLEQCGAVYTCAGTWFDIGSGFINAAIGHGPFLVNGGAYGASFENFAVDEPGQPAPPVAVTDGSGQITGYSPSTWTPAAYWNVFELEGVPNVTFRHIEFNGVSQGILAIGSGRMVADDIRGQVFYATFNIQESYDVTRITNVHMWPFWSSADPVMLYQQSSADVIVTYRDDSPQFDNIFGFQVNSVIRVGANMDGTTTGAQVGRVQCDSAVHCIQFDPQTIAQPSLSIDQVRTFDNVWSTIHGHPPLVHNPGSTMFKMDAAATLQVNLAENFGTDISTLDALNGRQPSSVTIGSLLVHENQMSANSYLARFSTARGALGSIVTLGVPPLLAGTISGFQYTNTLPSKGGGTGTLRWPTPAVVH